jgi:N-acetylglucosaminyl-diphospho-decaprenol L-rhamnosyltransferase
VPGVSDRAATRSDGPIGAVVVTFESAATLGRCLAALRAAAPRRGLEIRVVDNASTDGSFALAESALGPGGVIRMPANRGFAAGVNAGMMALETPWIAVLNPDVEVPPGGLDRLADALERHPRAGLAGPRAIGGDGHPERTVGPFPSPAREWAHSWLLDHVGWPGRFAPQPRATRAVDWVSGCAWLLRAEAARAVGPLDEAYFMYFEDVDYCRRLREAGWDVIHVPEVAWVHGLGRGSRETGLQPADGGRAALRYFAKFHPDLSQDRARALLLRGWRLRLAWRRLRARLGDAHSTAVARRYEIAIERVTGE